MTKLFCSVALLFSACSHHSQPQGKPAPTNAMAAGQPTSSQFRLPTGGQSKTPLWIPMPKDKAQLQRLLAMGYTIHEDHLHAPGVTSCPKMSENPVQ